MTPGPAYLGGRVEANRTTAVLVAGDLLAIGGFVLAGELHHGYTIAVLVQRWGVTTATFVVGWWLLAAVGGLYTADAVRSPKQAGSWGVPAWIVGALVAQGLRATPLHPGGASLSFYLVSVAFGGGLVVGWRVAYALLRARP
jgi:hypothetical protein